ncbi:branched-chain amino acid ABC transporter permease [Halobaculum gomorrense]|uniref:Branched-chain amino acid transport system permease protein n=1 Tax=Halobaculum gomorrense TaxID=43928 RepID=A0A1M5V131_9EURY|nr:branched-chain amino acid ABC transporter permease [Halobaculum gomorrense]SHH69007.1 branched-chain amino acid transport system permease protein [Halobaculum gomorrense]
MSSADADADGSSDATAAPGGATAGDPGDGDNGRYVSGWTPYREWFRDRWAQGGAAAWGTALAHLLVGALLFALVAGFDLGSLPIGGSLIWFLYLSLTVGVLYVATAPPAEPYVAWLDERWMESDVDKLLIVLGHVVLVFFVFAVALGLPFNGLVGALASVFFFTAVYAMMVLALNLHWGYAGIFNIGIAGFMAVGVYVMAILSGSTDPGPASVPGLGLPLPIGILGGVVAAALVGLVAALPALRLRADYFAIVTVALSEIIRITLKSTALQEFTIAGITTGTGGATGITMPGNPVRLLFYQSFDAGAEPALLGSVLFPLLEGLRVTLIPPGSSWLGIVPLPAFTLDLAVEPAVIANLAYVLVLAAFVALFYVLLVRTGNSPFGRVLKAIREDEVVAKSLGKDTNRFKIVAFMFGCGLMGLGGILWQGSQGFTNPGAFRPIITFYIWVALIIGGAGSNTGSVLGGALFAGAIWEGPVYVRRVVTNFVEFGDTPGTFPAAVAPLIEGKVLPLLSFLLANVSALRFILVGVILVTLMQRRPEGLLGHRKEEAAAIPLTRPGGGDGDGIGEPTAAADPVADGGRDDAADGGAR